MDTQIRHAIEHYTDTDAPNGPDQLSFTIKHEDGASPGKGFRYWVENTSDRRGTAVVQTTDVIHNTRKWDVVTLGPGGRQDLGYDRPDGPVYRQWYYFTTSTGRAGDRPWYPPPRTDSAFGSLVVMEQQRGDNWFLINRDTFQQCHVSWESNLGLQEVTIDEGSLDLGDVSIPGRPHRLEVIFANLMRPTNLAVDEGDGAIESTPHAQIPREADLPRQRG